MPEDKKTRLLEQVRNKIRYKHYSIRTEEGMKDGVMKDGVRFLLLHQSFCLQK